MFQSRLTYFATFWYIYDWLLDQVIGFKGSLSDLLFHKLLLYNIDGKMYLEIKHCIEIQ